MVFHWFGLSYDKEEGGKKIVHEFFCRALKVCDLISSTLYVLTTKNFNNLMKRTVNESQLTSLATKELIDILY